VDLLAFAQIFSDHPIDESFYRLHLFPSSRLQAARSNGVGTIFPRASFLEAIGALFSYLYLLWGPVLTLFVVVPFLRKAESTSLPLYLIVVLLLTLFAGPVYYKGMFMLAPWWAGQMWLGPPDKSYLVHYAGILLALYFFKRVIVR
jgi:hypothetical protein